METTPGVGSEPRRFERDSARAVQIAKQAVEVYESDQTLPELEQFLKVLIARQCDAILEIGTFSGGTAWAFSQTSSLVVTIDKKNTTSVDESNGIVYVSGNSHALKVREEVVEILSMHDVDCLFIDGDHTYEGAKEDHLAFSPLVVDDGIVAFHDIRGGNEDVRRYWEELKEKPVYFHNAEIIKDRSKRHGIGYYYK